jgi:hypothetical protein
MCHLSLARDALRGATTPGTGRLRRTNVARSLARWVEALMIELVPLDSGYESSDAQIQQRRGENGARFPDAGMSDTPGFVAMMALLDTCDKRRRTRFQHAAEMHSTPPVTSRAEC